MQLAKNAYFDQAITPAAGVAAATDLNGSTIDTQGFLSALFITTFGAIVANAVTSIKLQHGDASDASDMADVSGTSVTIADSDDNKTVVLELHRVVKRYCRVVVSRATQNATVMVSNVVLLNPLQAPISSHGTPIKSAVSVVVPAA